MIKEKIMGIMSNKVKFFLKFLNCKLSKLKYFENDKATKIIKYSKIIILDWVRIIPGIIKTVKNIFSLREFILKKIRKNNSIISAILPKPEDLGEIISGKNSTFLV